jgi:hypothetical protein
MSNKTPPVGTFAERKAAFDAVYDYKLSILPKEDGDE